jgi:hypothetical protein
MVRLSGGVAPFRCGRSNGSGLARLVDAFEPGRSLPTFGSRFSPRSSSPPWERRAIARVFACEHGNGAAENGTDPLGIIQLKARTDNFPRRVRFQERRTLFGRVAVNAQPRDGTVGETYDRPGDVRGFDSRIEAGSAEGASGRAFASGPDSPRPREAIRTERSVPAPPAR